MRIIATQTITHADGRAPTRPGQVVDLPETHARVMIGRGMARPAPTPTPEPAPLRSKRASRKAEPAPTNTDGTPDTTEAP